MFVTNWISTTKIQKISEITNFFRHYFLSRTEVIMGHQEDIVKTESKIIVIRDTQVILDRDVAELYGVTTKVVNQAIRNNPDKFPSGYVIELTNSEKEHVVKNFDHHDSHRHCHH